MGLPRYIASAALGDLERTVTLADELVAPDARGPVCLVQCGRKSDQAAEVARELQSRGRLTRLLVLNDRQEAHSERTLRTLAIASAAWVFADDLLATFYEVLASPAAFALRERAAEGVPVIGIGGGALALGGLLLAARVCTRSRYDLVAGLGWAPRTLIDADLWSDEVASYVANDSVRTLPGLLGLQLGQHGAVRVEGGRIESIGDEPVRVLGNDGRTGLLRLNLAPGLAARIAPPPFAPFERGLLPAALLRELEQVESLRRTRTPATIAEVQAPTPVPVVAPAAPDKHEQPGSGRKCPLCNQVHTSDKPIELAA